MHTILRIAAVVALTVAATAVIVRIRGRETNRGFSPVVTTIVALFFAATFGLVVFAVR